jgi:hypothetical protein
LNKYKRFIQFELRLIGMLSFILATAAFIDFQRDHPQFVYETRQSAAPAEMQYLSYCDGRPSAVLGSIKESVCLADYPGEFAFGVITLLTLFAFIILSCLAFAYIMLSKKTVEALDVTMTRINYLLQVTDLPADLQEASKDVNSDLYNTYEVYQMLVKSSLLWQVWYIDQYGKHWVCVNFIKNGEPEFHTIAVDEGSYTKVEHDDYDVLAD